MIVPRLGTAQSTVTQEVELDAGWNIVSLRVQPSDASFAALFDGSPLTAVKDNVGKAYFPSEGVEQISTWKSDEGYKIHVETATTLEVTGTELRPEASPIVLEKGGNIVPYIPATTLAVEPALVSVEESLVAVEDEDGTQYDPTASSSPLDSLRAGQGYKVYVDRADTLRYPRVVNTLDNALALEGMEVGRYVQVRGYHEPGDKGGGLFQVTNSAARTDGGTTFAFDADLSTEQEVNHGTDLYGTNYSDSDIAWRTFEIQYGADSTQVWDIWDLHGHKRKTKNRPLVNTKGGGLATGNYPGWRSDYTSGDPDFISRYKYITSDRRLQRLDVGNTVNVAWWGAKPTSEGYNGPEDDQTNKINWAVSTAKQLRNEKNLSRAYVDVPDVYYKTYWTLMPPEVLIRGTGTEKTWPDGTVTKGGFKMPPGEALWHMDSRVDPRPILTDKRFGFTHGHLPEWIGMKNIEVNGNIANNQEPFTNPTPYGGSGAVANGLQNSSYWTGWRTDERGVESPSDTDKTYQYIEGMDLYLRDVAVDALGGNGINASGASVEGNWDGVFMDTGLRNHTIYGVTGNPKNVTTEGAEGSGWAAHNKLGVWKDSQANGAIGANKKGAHARRGESQQWSPTWTNLEIRNLQKNPHYYWTQVLNIERGHVTIDGLTVDLTDSEFNEETNAPMRIFNNNGFNGAVVKDGTIYTPSNSASAKKIEFLRRFGSKNPYSFRDYEISKYKNITIEDKHGPGVQFGNINQKISFSNIIYRDITLNAQGVSGVGATEAFMGTFADIAFGNSFIKTIPGAKRLVFDNFTLNRPVAFIGRFGGRNLDPGEGNPQDIFVSNSEVDNQSNFSTHIRTASEDHLYGVNDRIYMHNTTFTVPTGLSENKFHYAFEDGTRSAGTDPGGTTITVEGGATIRVRNCETHSGLVSDSENNTFTSDASDEGNDFVLIPTSLLSRPREVNLTLTGSGPNVSSITGWDVANSDGSLRPDTAPNEHEPYLKVSLDGTIGSGETVTIDWTARVTPLDEYSPTGVFISRPSLHESTTLTSGKGPWTLDLRGLAASQETWTPPAYSASSSDTGVVTANVTATNHRGTDRFWKLELTEQSAGTATITVDAEIPGVGTATTTFEITVE